MNKTLESVRGSWITRDSEVAEECRNHLRQSIDKIPTELRESFQIVLDWAETTEQWDDLIIDCTAKHLEERFKEVQFVETQIKGLIDAIRSTKDVESINALRAVTRETLERMNERKHLQELKNLEDSMKFQASLSPTNPKTA